MALSVYPKELIESLEAQLAAMTQERDSLRLELLAEHQAAVDMFCRYDAAVDKLKIAEVALEEIAALPIPDYQDDPSLANTISKAALAVIRKDSK